MKEGTLSSLSSCSFLVLERSIVFGGISCHHHTEYNALVRCVFAISQHTACLLECVMNCIPAEDFQLEQRIMQKKQEKPFQQN
jgi:hypothetical protein